MAERKKKGNPSKAHQHHQHQTTHGQPTGVTSSPDATGPNTAAAALASQGMALNPPFDPRMRKVGSPLNLAAQIKRGWIQSVDGSERVNFLFNPAAIDIASTVNPDVTKTPLQAPDSADVLDEFYTSTGSSTGISLLYDRTYELFSTGPTTSPAATFGVWADFIAWYKFLKMVDSIPTSWSGAIFAQPMNQVPAYLFVGPNLYFYGFVASLTCTVTHWTQFMVPQRGKVDIAFTILPLPSGSPQILHADGSTASAVPNPVAAAQGWVGTVFGNGNGGGLYDSLFGSDGRAPLSVSNAGDYLTEDDLP